MMANCLHKGQTDDSSRTSLPSLQRRHLSEWLTGTVLLQLLEVSFHHAWVPLLKPLLSASHSESTSDTPLYRVSVMKLLRLLQNLAGG